MNEHLLEAPTELAAGVEAINALCASENKGTRVFALACKTALENGGKTAPVPENAYESTKPSLTLAAEVRSSISPAALNTIEYILTGAVLHKCDPKALVKAVSKRCELSKTAIRVLGTKYLEYVEEATAEARGDGTAAAATGTSGVESVGELVDLEWRLSVGLESSISTSLRVPRVTLAFVTRDPDRRRRTHTAELTVAEFRQLARTIRTVRDSLRDLA